MRGVKERTAGRDERYFDSELTAAKVRGAL